jgi:hypothetical protein
MPVWDGTLTTGLGRHLVLGYEGIFTERRSAFGRDVFTQHQVALGGIVGTTRSPFPGALVFAVGVSDSAERFAGGLRPPGRSGERAFVAESGVRRRLGPIRADMGVKWTMGALKPSRRYESQWAAGLGARARVLSLKPGVEADVFIEAAPFLRNPFGIPTAWSVGTLLSGPGRGILAVFASNTYGSALANSYHGQRWTLYGFRLSRAFGPWGGGPSGANR